MDNYELKRIATSLDEIKGHLWEWRSDVRSRRATVKGALEGLAIGGMFMLIVVIILLVVPGPNHQEPSPGVEAAVGKPPAAAR
jgi:hypothetical protein